MHIFHFIYHNIISHPHFPFHILYYHFTQILITFGAQISYYHLKHIFHFICHVITSYFMSSFYILYHHFAHIFFNHISYHNSIYHFIIAHIFFNRISYHHFICHIIISLTFFVSFILSSFHTSCHNFTHIFPIIYHHPIYHVIKSQTCSISYITSSFHTDFPFHVSYHHIFLFSITKLHHFHTHVFYHSTSEST